MKITEFPMIPTTEELVFLGELTNDDETIVQFNQNHLELAKSLFDKVFPESKPSSIAGLEVSLYVDGFVFRTPFIANEAHFFAILRDPVARDSWKSYHIDFEGSHCFHYYPLKYFPFSLRVELWQNALSRRL